MWSADGSPQWKHRHHTSWCCVSADPPHPSQGLLTSLNLTPVSPRAYAKHHERFLHKRFVGTGPYRLTHFSEHQQRLEPFADYWGPAPRNTGSGSDQPQ